ncbi:hypothetical protein [Lacticaseibacillus jixiensis]|uniref:hypothetical protein n=1 Tax=Lacticaseibacillus jixiensis TaxID=3231926 RepID=UPI0036F441B9
MSNYGYLRDTIIEYEFNAAAFEAKYRLILVKLQSKADFAIFHQFVQATSPQALCRVHQLQYLLLYNDLPHTWLPGLNYTQLHLATMREQHIFPNHLLQLLVNQLGAIAPLPNITPTLLISRKEQHKSWQNGLVWRYAARVVVNWENALEITVRTFAETTEPPAQSDTYLYDQAHLRMVHNLAPVVGPVFILGNHSKSNNTIDWVDLAELDKFEATKVGLATKIMAGLHDHFKGLFEIVPHWHMAELLQLQQPRLASTATVWDSYVGQQLNIFGSGNLADQLADELAQAMQASAQLQAQGVSVQRSTQAQTGWNIQAVPSVEHDLDHAYQVGNATTIIQHITPEQFGRLDHKGHLNWRTKSQADAALQASVIKLAQELLIKRDVYTKHLTVPAPDVLAQTVGMTFYTFEWHHDAPDAQVYVHSLQVTADAQLHFATHLVHLAQADPLCAWVGRTLLHGQLKKYYWQQQVACVIEYRGHYSAIMRTDTQTIPDTTRLADLLQAGRDTKRLTRQEVAQALIQLAKVTDEPLPQLETMMKLVQSLPQRFYLGDLRQAMKSDPTLSFRLGVMRQLSRALYAIGGFALTTGARQKINGDMLAGLSGIGLFTQEVHGMDNWYYFVGAAQGLQTNVARAVRLYQLVAQDDMLLLPGLFAKLAPLMTVDFVREGQYTCLPYPVKYLREYALQHQRLLNS